MPDEGFHAWSPYEPNLYIINKELFSELNYMYDSISPYTTKRKI